jgi:hypothetical protein
MEQITIGSPQDEDLRIISTGVLFELIANGVKHDFNRLLDSRKVAKVVDLDGMHILRRVIAFHEQYKPNVDHHRAQLLMKIKGTEEPEYVFIDISDKDWNQLSTVAEYIRGELGHGIRKVSVVVGQPDRTAAWGTQLRDR